MLDICANIAEAVRKVEKSIVTMHKVAPEVRENVSIPLLHIAQVTARKLKEAGITTVGLLGTRYTMTQPFYIDVLLREGIEVLVPEGDTIDRRGRNI